MSYTTFPPIFASPYFFLLRNARPHPRTHPHPCHADLERLGGLHGRARLRTGYPGRLRRRLPPGLLCDARVKRTDTVTNLACHVSGRSSLQAGTAWSIARRIWVDPCCRARLASYNPLTFWTWGAEKSVAFEADILCRQQACTALLLSWVPGTRAWQGFRRARTGDGAHTASREPLPRDLVASDVCHWRWHCRSRLWRGAARHVCVSDDSVWDTGALLSEHEGTVLVRPSKQASCKLQLASALRPQGPTANHTPLCLGKPTWTHG